ncbi:hypothetical protein M758_2G179300 [Ceratodon purpureus]|nr:hypothetical protein M758_2G179300 [Ceratodon purpureus]
MVGVVALPWCLLVCLRGMGGSLGCCVSRFFSVFTDRCYCLMRVLRSDFLIF